jgi:hypothetical protein
MCLRALRFAVVLAALAQIWCPAVSLAEVPRDQARAILEAGNRRFVDGQAVAHTWQREKVVTTGA